MLKFISDHKKIIIGLVLYIAVFVVSIFISPWQSVDGMLAGTAEGSTTALKWAVNIMFFGIYELLELMMYAMSSDVLGSIDTGMFFIAACTVFTYMSIIKTFALDGGFKDVVLVDHEFKPEDIAADYFYDNVFAYIGCVIVYYLYSPVSAFVVDKFRGGSVVWIVLMSLALGILFFIPSIPHILHVALYLAVTYKITQLIAYLDTTLQWNAILKNVVIFLIALVLVILANVILNKLLNIIEAVTGSIMLALLTQIAQFVTQVFLFFLLVLVLAFVLSAYMKSRQ